MKSKLLAPNGKLSNLTTEQYKLVRTPEFKAWFGDWENDPENASKVVDENGEPLVVYHGVKDEYSGWNVFNVVNQSQEVGVHFGTYDQALAIVRDSDYFPLQIFSCFLRVINPLQVDDITSWTPKNYEFIFRKNNIPYNKSGSFLGNLFTIPTDVINAFNVVNIDGLMYQNIYEGSGVSYIVFEPSQIKLADGTNTTFDNSNPDIRYNNGGKMNSNLIAPNGNPSNLTAEQYKLVRTKAFKDWFGDWENNPANSSKVVDKNGEPLVVYHGSSDNFNTFEPREKKVGRRKTSAKGFYFTNNSWVARQYAGSDGFVKPYFLRILKYPTTADKKVLEYSNIDDYLSDYGKTISQFGYDGAIDYNGDYIVFEPTQIKLADGTNTTFDNSNPDIRYNNGGKIRLDRSGNEIGSGNWHKAYKVFDFDDYPYISHRVDKSNSTESVYVTYSNNENGKSIKVRFSSHENNATKFGDELDGDFATKLQVLYHLGLAKRTFIPNTYLSIQKRKIAKKELGKYEVADKTIQELFALGEGADISEFKGKIAKNSNYLLLGDLVTREKEEVIDSLGREVILGKYEYDEIGRADKSNIRFNNGGKMKKVDKGGITYGKSHDEGGIPVKNASTGQMLEVEGGEGIVNKRSMASDKMVKLNGKQMSICEAVSHLNQMEGGVKFSCDDVSHRQFIEEMELGGELERGIRTEKEHIETLRKLYENRITPTKAVEEVAKEHIAENPNYYSDLQKMNESKGLQYYANTLGMDEGKLSQMIFDMQGKSVARMREYEPIEKPDFEEDDLTRFSNGGMSNIYCGCSRHRKKYLDGGMFGSGFGSLDDFIGKNIEQQKKKDDSQYAVEVIERARQLLDRDYKYQIVSSVSDKYKVFFQNPKEVNLYKEGWRFKFGESREWAGLCAYQGLVFDRNKKMMYLSINFVKHDENWLENEKDTILHEMAHAIVDEYILTKTFNFEGLDPLHKPNEGHGEAWSQMCKALNPEGNCERFYGNAKLKESFKPYKYDCGFCGSTKYGSSRNFTNICFKCIKPVIVTKND